MLATFSEVFEFPRRSLKEVRFQYYFEAIWERRVEAKTSVSLQRGCKNQLLEYVDFGRPLGAIWEAKMEAKMEPQWSLRAFVRAIKNMSEKSKQKKKTVLAWEREAREMKEVSETC